MKKEMEHKTFPFIELKVDEEQGIVEHLIAIHGVLDLGNDISHLGSFSKTIQERGLKVKVLDKHRTDSVTAVVGKPLELREIGRDELPTELLTNYPEATGATRATTQFLIETPEGKGIFQRIKAGAVDEFSYGYDAIVYDHEDIKTKSGDTVTVRHLREVKLYEYGPVIFAMQPATQTLSAKDGDEKELVVRCPSCGFETSAPIELDDLMTCPKCETQMERVEAKEPEDDPEQEKVEVTENFIHVPALGEQGKHKGHRIRTKTLSASKGIKGRYCGECKKMISFLFDKEKWDVARAKKWVADHSKGLDFALAHKLEEVPDEEEKTKEIAKELLEIELLRIDAVDIGA